MGKKNKHSQDKLHKTVTELKSHHVLNRDLELSALHRRLKFDSCCLSLNTITDKPVGLCDEEGFCYIFECDLILKFLEKHQIHPVTGTKVNATNLIELKFHKNNDNQYHCPVNLKLFNQHSKIVANKKTGNVFSYEAYYKLNLRENNFHDLLTNEAFEKSDIVTIQDPEKADEKWNVTNFYHIKNKLKIDDDSSGSYIRNIEQSSILKSCLDEYKRQETTIVETFNKIVGQDEGSSKEAKIKLDKINSANQSDGSLSRSVTSTVMPIASVQNPALLNQEEILYPRIKKKGYVQLVTNFGPINLELYCDRTPKTCHNFLLLAGRGYYDNTCFHRLIKNFILQGGDPTGTGSGGQSAWGEPFKNECFADLKHNCRGILAMANSGPNTNKSQFYITLGGSWDHLDNKHTIFGRVVGGEETLHRIEKVDVDKKDKPKSEIKIIKVVKYVDPFEEVEKQIDEERKKELDNKRCLMRKANDKEDRSNQPLKKFREGIGAYIDLEKFNNKMSNSNNTTTKSGSMFNQVTLSSSSLSSKLASLDKSTKSSAKKYGDFSDW